MKRESFKHEDELRAVIVEPDELRSEEPGKYIKIPLPLDTLIAEIRVAPNAKDWFKQAVEGIVGRYSTDIPVNKSSLDADAFR
jgi:hypothetical protein